MEYFLGICNKAIGEKGQHCYVDWYANGCQKDIIKEYIKIVKQQSETLLKEQLIGAVPSKYKNNYRLNDEFVKLNILQIDLDKQVPESIIDNLKTSEYNCFWIESPSSGIPGKGFRLRIYVFLENEVDNIDVLRDNYMYNVNNFFKSCGLINIKVDDSAKRATQFMYIPNKSKLKSLGYILNKSNFQFAIDPVKALVQERFEYISDIELSEKQKDVLKRSWVNKLNRDVWRDGERHNKAYIFARDASARQIDINFTTHEIIKKYLSSGSAGKGYETNLKKTIKDAYSKINRLNERMIEYISKFKEEKDYMKMLASGGGK